MTTSEAPNPPQITIRRIIEIVAAERGLTRSDLVGSCKSAVIVHARHEAMTAAREFTNHSFPMIGRAFGDRDHTTVIHAIAQTERRRAENVSFRAENDMLMRRISNDTPPGNEQTRALQAAAVLSISQPTALNLSEIQMLGHTIVVIDSLLGADSLTDADFRASVIHFLKNPVRGVL